MKKYICGVCVMVMTFLCACGSDPEPGENIHEPIGNAVYIVRLTKPEYKEMVLADRCKGGYVSYCTNKYGEPIGKAGYSPYWELPDGWMLVDWKWSGFYLINYGEITALTKQTWDIYDGLDAKGNPQKWLLTEPHTKENAVSGFDEIPVPYLEAYSQEHYGEETVHLLKQHFSGLQMCDQSEKMDSIWTILQTELSIVIEKGDLDNLWKYEPEEDSYWYK